MSSQQQRQAQGKDTKDSSLSGQQQQKQQDFSGGMSDIKQGQSNLPGMGQQDILAGQKFAGSSGIGEAGKFQGSSQQYSKESDQQRFGVGGGQQQEQWRAGQNVEGQQQKNLGQQQQYQQKDVLGEKADISKLSQEDRNKNLEKGLSGQQQQYSAGQNVSGQNK